MEFSDRLAISVPAKRPAARGNSLVLVTAILVLLVIIATAFLVRSQGGRTQAAAAQASAGRQARSESIALDIAQEVADSLFVKRIDRARMGAQVTANQQGGLGANPLLGEFVARSDFPRLPPEPLSIRYGVDYFDFFDNRTRGPDPLGNPAAAVEDGFLDGYNFAPFSVNPFTNWPDRYGQVVSGEENPVGNPGFGDLRWLASTEPVRARTMQQFENPVAPAPPNERVSLPFSAQWSNLALRRFGNAAEQRSAVLDPLGIGFSHWPHLSWIASAENGFRVAWNIASLEGYGANQGSDYMGNEPGVLTGSPGTAGGELALGVPYEQWLPWVAPREARLLGEDAASGFLILDPADWRTRVRQWFNVGSGLPGTHFQTITAQSAPDPVAAATLRASAMPNFLQLAAFGTPADEFGVYTQADQAQGLIPTGYSVGNPKPRNLISRTLADADGDGWTDSFWFLAPTTSDRGTRQLVAARIIDNSALVNVNIATRFERGNTIGQTPSDVALVGRRESYDESGGQQSPASQAAFRDTPVGFFNARENDPEYRANFDFKTPLPGIPPAAQNPNRLVYAVSAAPGSGAPQGGVDVGWAPDRWEGPRLQATNPGATAADPYQPNMLASLGLITEGAAGAQNLPLPFFDRSDDLGGAGTNLYGEQFLLTRQADRINYFKAMSLKGEVVDPVTAARIASLTPFGADDEVELRAANGLNSPQVVSRLESALNSSAPLTESDLAFGQFMRSTRSREETARFYSPDDVRVQDWRARRVWNGNVDADVSPAARSGAELLLDHRRLMTTISGARNDILPPRLWSIRDHSNHPQSVPDAAFRGDDVRLSFPAFLRRGIDRNRDGAPDDVTGDGVVTLADDLAPFHPNIMFPSDSAAAMIQPNPATNPFGFPIRDAEPDGRITVRDFERARERFLFDNRKFDLRQPVDPPQPNGTNSVTPASRVVQLQNKMAQVDDVQRLLRRALTDEASRQSYFGRPGQSDQDANAALAATKLMTLSLATNLQTWRDGREPRTSAAGVNINAVPLTDPPFHPLEAKPIPPDAQTNPNLANAKFIGVEKQPYIMEVFLAFVYPKTKLEQSDIDAVVTDGAGNPNDGCPDPATCQIDAGNPYALPPCTINGAGENFVVYDPNDPNTRPAVVFAVQLANPYNEPVGLADFEIRVNSATGNSQRFQFLRLSPPNSVSGNPYGQDVQLGPCTPEEPRTAIVFSIPATFPNGDRFPRDAWLDFLDLRASIDGGPGDPPDGTISANEGDPNNDTLPGQPFPPDANAIYRPAWGGLPGSQPFEANRRSGTLLFDATTTTPPSPAYVGFNVSGNLSLWTPPPVTNSVPPGPSFIELNRLVTPANPSGAPVWVTVDRFDNHLDTDLDSSSGQRFADQVARLFVDGPGGGLPPPPKIECRPGGLAIDGIRLRTDEYFVSWARSSRQWLFDTQNGVQGNPPGRGRLTLDERAPRWVFARQTGTMSSANPTQGAPAQQTYVGGVVDPSGRRGHVSSRTTHPDAPNGAQNLPIFAQYVNMWGEQRRGKPTFFPCRIPERWDVNNPAGPQERVYVYPAWGVNDADLTVDPPGPVPQTGIALNFGEKGVTDPQFVNGANPDNFTAPLRMFQKDADFDQVAEILDVPLWGPLINAPPSAMTPGGIVRAIATLPEILAQPANSSASVKFPKFPPPAVPPDQLPDYGPYPASLNRLILEPAQYDVNVPAGGRAGFLSGVPALPREVLPGTATAAPKQQGAIGFNSSLVAGTALLDAFTIDDRGAGVLLDSTTDTNTANGVISFQERAQAEDRRFRLAGGFQGRMTPGLININTAPIEVLRSMPQMLRLVYDDDFPIVRGSLSDPATLAVATSDLGKRRAIRAEPGLLASDLPGLWDVPAQDLSRLSGPPGPANPASIQFDWGASAPRVRVAESIELWRNKGNVRADLSNNEHTDMPSYFSRGVDLPEDGNHREWASDSRGQRGFDSVGELALLTRGAEFNPGTVDSDGDGTPDIREIIARTASDANRNNIDDANDNEALVGGSWTQALSWNVRFAGQDPFRTRWLQAASDWGAGWNTRSLAGIPPAPDQPTDPLQKFTDGIPRLQTAGSAVPQQFPLSGRTAIDKHLITVARDDRTSTTVVETNDTTNDSLNVPPANAYTEFRTLRHDRTAGDAIEQNQLLKGISNIATTRSDVFTVWLRIRTVRQDRLTGQWNGTDPSLIVDDSRYLMTIDRSSVDRPGERPRIVNFVKVNN